MGNERARWYNEHGKQVDQHGRVLSDQEIAALDGERPPGAEPYQFSQPSIAEMDGPEARQARVIGEVVAERRRQDAKRGVQNHPDMRIWASILTEEVGETAQAANDHEFEKARGTSEAQRASRVALDQMRHEAIQTAAVAVAIVEAIDRKRAQS